MSKVQIRQRGGQNPRLTSAETATVWPSRLSHADQRDQPSHGYIYRPNDRMDCIMSTPASDPCARRVAGGSSTRRAINMITGDTLWEPVIGRKPVNRLTGYRFTSLLFNTAFSTC